MADIDVNALPEELPQVDWDAPESGSFPPRLYPGTYEFIFRLPETQDEQFKVVEILNKDRGVKEAHLQVNFTASIPQHAYAGHTVGDPPESGEEINIPFNRASFYKSTKMPISMAADLMRSLGIRLSGAFTKSAVMQAFREADGRAVGHGDLVWRAYCKNCDHTISTQPNKKRNEQPWPKEGGQWALQATCAKCGAKYFGREELNRFKLPEAAA